MAKIVFISTAYENLAIQYFSSYLKQEGHQVQLILDPCLFNNPYNNTFLKNSFSYTNQILQQMQAITPDLICFSIITDTYQWGLTLAKKIKEILPTPIIFGGIHPSALPEKVIKEKCIDYLCIGEGEQALVKLANALTAKQTTENIKNIWTKKNNIIIKNEIDSIPIDLDSLPLPDKDLYYGQSTIYQNEYFIMVSRGCQYACTFCCNQIWQQLYNKQFLRRRSVSNVIYELTLAKKNYSPKFVWFMDDNFTYDTDWLNKFCKTYKQTIDLPFFCYSHPNNMNIKKAKLLSEAGCKEIALGVESLNETTNTNLNRTYNKEKIAKAINDLQECNIFTATENILNFPNETNTDISTLIKFYSDCTPNLIIFSWLKIFPNTPLFQQLQTTNKLSPNQIKAIKNGTDKSLSLGGNIIKNNNCKKIISLLVLTAILPKTIIDFLLKTKSYKLIPLNPITLLRLIRILSSYILRSNYDVGLKISCKIYLYFTIKMILTIFQKKK